MSKNRHIRAIIVVLYICITIFIDCTGYATGTLTLPSKLKTIEEEAFYGDKSIGSVVLPNTIKKIGDRAFANSSLTEITLPSSITSISDSAFDGCKKVIAYTIENSTAYNFVEAHSNMINRRLLSDTEKKNAALYTYSTIDANACSLTGYVGTASKLTIPAYSIEGIKVTKIADKAFEGNTVISSVTIPETVESIDEYAFHNCSSLKSVDMKDGVTSIGRRVFENCTSLVDIHLSNKINHMHEYVFLGCSKLKTLTYPLGMVTKPSDRAWTQGWGYDHASALSKSSVETLIIPDGATAIMKDAFFDATSLKKVYIPASVTSFDQDPGNSGVTHTAFQNITKKITIYGVKGSTSETYAKAKGIAFVDQSATPTVSPTPSMTPMPDTPNPATATPKPATATPKPATATPSPVVYTIKYNANGGSGAPSSQTKTKDVTLTLSSTKPTRSGYTFLGWSTSSIATTATYAAGGTYTKNANATLYAVWEKIPVYTISYNANGGSGAPSSQTKTKDVALVLSSTKPTRSGYTFLGWAASSGATIVSYYPGDTYYTNKNITLYAVWELDHTTFIVKHGSEVIIADGYVEGYFACGEGAGKDATATFTITADDSWTVRATDTSWMTVSTQDGTKAVITIGDVQDGESYSSTLIFTCNGERYDLYVTLDKPGSTPKPATATPKPTTATPKPDAQFTVMHGNEYVIIQGSKSGIFECGSGSGYGATASFTVSSDDSWSVTLDDSSWATLKKTNNTKATLTIGEVEDGEYYSSTATFTSNGQKYIVEIILDKTNIVSAPSLSVKIEHANTIYGPYTNTKNSNTGITVQAGTQSLWPEVTFSNGLNRLEVAVFNGGGYEIPIISYANYSQGERTGTTGNYIVTGNVDDCTNPYVPGIYFPEDMEAGTYWLTAIADNSAGHTEVKIEIIVTNGVGNTSWSWPLKGTIVKTSGFIPNRRVSASQNVTAHLGIDCYSQSGNLNIYPINNGIVEKVENSLSSHAGRYIIIKHNYDGRTVYSEYQHLASIKVSVGDNVTTSTVIGVVGGSGITENEYGLHLHYEVFTGVCNPFAPMQKDYPLNEEITGPISINGTTYYNPEKLITGITPIQ